MGIITLGIGPPPPNMTYLLTGGLDMGAASAPVPVYTAMSEIRLVATSAAAARLTATAEAELEP